MAFDRTNPTHLATLKTEDARIFLLVDGGRTTEILEMFNNPALNPGGESINRPTEKLNIPEIAGVIDGAEYETLSAWDKEWVKMFISQAADVRLKPFQIKFVEVFPSGSPTLTAVLALRSKLASLGEVLFGVTTVIRESDLLAARIS